MATLDDVQDALVAALGGFLFPGQSYLPGAVATCQAPLSGLPGGAATPVPVRLFADSPGMAALNADVQGGISNIVVTRQKGFSRNTTRFPAHWKTVQANQPTYTIAIQSGGFLVGGSSGANNLTAVAVGQTWYAYAPTASDTPATVAAAYAANIPGATASGAQVTVANVASAATGALQGELFATGTAEDLFNVAVLAVPTAAQSGPIIRAALCRLVETLGAMQDSAGNLTRFLPLSDGSNARLLRHDVLDDDTTRREDIWRRWYGYRVEYDLGASMLLPVMIAPILNLDLPGNATLVVLPPNPAN